MGSTGDDLFNSYYAVGGYGSTSGLYGNGQEPASKSNMYNNTITTNSQPAVMEDYSLYLNNDDFTPQNYDYNTYDDDPYTSTLTSQNFSTTYQNEYIETSPVSGEYDAYVTSPRAEQYHSPDVPFYGQTTNRETYQPQESAGRVENFKPEQTTSMKDIPFYGDTTHRSEYIWKTADRPESFNPNNDAQNSQPRNIPAFESETTNRSVYLPKTSERPERAHQPQSQYPSPNPIPFYGSTTHRDHYVPKTVAKPEMVRPKSFSDFGSGSQFEGITTHRHDYVEKHADRSPIIRPNNNALRSGEKFDGLSESHDAYVPKYARVERNQLRPKTGVGLAGNMDTNTTHRVDFTPKYANRTSAYKPEESYLISHGNFDSNTTHLVDYQRWTNQKRAPLRPHSSRHVSNDQFDGNTTHRVDYTEKHVKQCPAEQLLREGKLAGYAAHGYNSQGHRLYMNHRRSHSSGSAGSNGSRRNISMVQRFTQVPKGERPMTPVETPPIPV